MRPLHLPICASNQQLKIRLKSTCGFLGLQSYGLPFTHPQPISKPISFNHSDLSIIFVQPQNVTILLGLSPKLPTLKTIIALGDIPGDARSIATAWGRERGIRILTLSEGKFVFGSLHLILDLTISRSVEAIGEEMPLPPPPVTADSVATICYTSVSDLPVGRVPWC